MCVWGGVMGGGGEVVSVCVCVCVCVFMHSTELFESV